MQDEGESLRRRQRVEHDEQREADRVGEERLVLGAVRRQRDDRLRELRADEVLATRAAGAQQVEADAGDDRRQPAAHVLDLARLGAVEPEPRLLYRVLRLAQRAEHPVGDRLQMGAMLLELSRLPLSARHRHILSAGSVIRETKHDGSM